jgi:hypothetical protein
MNFGARWRQMGGKEACKQVHMTVAVEKFGKPSDHKSATLTGSVAKICDCEETKYFKSATLPVSILKICDSSPQHCPSVVQKFARFKVGPKITSPQPVLQKN